VAAAGLAALPARAAEPAAGGAALMRAVETARATVVGVVREPAPIDRHGWAARLEIERVLAGALEPGATVRIAWEELARGRPPRFAADDRVLVALDPRPGGSLWRERFPKQELLAVGAEGNGFLRAPDAATIARVGAYLHVPEAEREGPTGVAALVHLAVDAAPRVAWGAIGRLRGIRGLATKLAEVDEARLARALDDPSRELELRSGVLGLIGERGLHELRPALVSQTRRDSPLEADAWRALAALDGGLAPSRVAVLLESQKAELRTIAVGHARGTPSEANVKALLRRDPDANVRVAAVEAWVAWHGAAVLDDAEPALFDPDPAVRLAAARAIGGLGAPAVPRLAVLVEDRRAGEVVAPMTALSFAGVAGHEALVRISFEHPDERVRKLAMLILGRDPYRH
jgi:hypothetical protein